MPSFGQNVVHLPGAVVGRQTVPAQPQWFGRHRVQPELLQLELEQPGDIRVPGRHVTHMLSTMLISGGETEGKDLLWEHGCIQADWSDAGGVFASAQHIAAQWRLH